MTFQWPLMLLGLSIIPVLLIIYLLIQRRRRTYAVRFTNLALLNTVIERKPGIRRHIPPVLYLLGMAALLVSLARPTAVIAVPRDQQTVLLVMDVSGSMAANDLQPSRMQAAKQAARSFVTALPEAAQVGLVSFSSAASVNAPITYDRNTVLRSIDALRANGGTAIGDGLNTALDQLTEQFGPATGLNRNQRPPAVVVLLSDGQSTDGMPVATAAGRAQREQVKVHTVGIGQRGASPVLGGGTGGGGQRGAASIQLDETTLRSIATQTGGKYFYAAESRELEQVYTDLGSQVSWVEERTEVTALASALGTLFLIIGGGLSLRWFQQLP